MQKELLCCDDIFESELSTGQLACRKLRTTFLDNAKDSLGSEFYDLQTRALTGARETSPTTGGSKGLL
jgi:hypothetical protein